jgi:radical SAM superfamily enzyme YgiQ (UPF0313 family)
MQLSALPAARDMGAGLQHVLPHVSRPARYTGNEWNSIRKDWAGRLRVALAYPDLYEESVCDPWTQSVYAALNADDGMLCERVYLPWPDMEQALRENGLPLFSLESQKPLAAFDAILVTLPDELHFPDVLALLDLAGCSVQAVDRRPTTAPVICGIGPATANPEPLAAFFDAFIMGSVDTAAVRALLAGAPGHDMGGSQAIYLPHTSGAPPPDVPLREATADRLSPQTTRPLVPFVEARHERGYVELAHTMLYPWTGQQALERPVEEILANVEAVLASTGYDHIHLAGRHSRLSEIVDRLSSRHTGHFLHVSLDAAPMSPDGVDMVDRLPRTSRGPLVFDLVAGNPSLRRQLNVIESDQEIIDATQLAFRRGWHIVRLRVQVGLPGETDSDIDALGALARRLRDIGRAEIDGRAQVQVVAEPVIARRGSPWQHCEPLDDTDWQRRSEMLEHSVRGACLRLQWHGRDERAWVMQLARGDRKTAALIEETWRTGKRRRSRA